MIQPPSVGPSVGPTITPTPNIASTCRLFLAGRRRTASPAPWTAARRRRFPAPRARRPAPPSDRRVAAEERRDREQHDRAGEIVSPAEGAREPRRHRHHDHVRDDVAGADPRDLFERRAEIPHHVRNRDVDDGGVDQLEHRGQRHREGDQVAGMVDLLPACVRPEAATRWQLTGQCSASGSTTSTDMPGAQRVLADRAAT